MSNFDLKRLVRPNIWNLAPYSCARTEFTGEASTFLDANENPYNANINRYPDPFQIDVKKKIVSIKGASVENICLGNGSDETIDLMYRIFCEPVVDNVVAIDPTYGMYRVCADINNVEYRSVLLDENFNFSAGNMLAKADAHTKIMWLCTPNNPTGNALNTEEIKDLIKEFSGIVVLDEAYIDFSSKPSFVKNLAEYPNLVILQTFSKAWGCAGIRLGMAFASTEIIDLMNKVKYPYNINILTQERISSMLDQPKQVEEWKKILLNERETLGHNLASLQYVEKIYPSDANFLLVKVDDANKLYQFLVSKGVIVRNRNSVSLCKGCVRITVGSPEENTELLKAMKEYQ
ncbi:MAG: histidinol-phosphate transaminase [Bacteroidales bacterium]|nr:histidinol-phosphate transaminase [Candidatus Physcocola equi]